MADFGSTKYNVSFEAWHELLMDYAELRGGSAMQHQMKYRMKLKIFSLTTAITHITK
ncbi:hypothetical protein GUB14_25770 [Escherichia coli]|nr:hypothetical protein [Escherichia coli]